MKIKIAVPDNHLYNSILLNDDFISGDDYFTFVKTNELDCLDLLITGKVDVAFLTPISFNLFPARDTVVLAKLRHAVKSRRIAITILPQIEDGGIPSLRPFQRNSLE